MISKSDIQSQSSVRYWNDPISDSKGQYFVLDIGNIKSNIDAHLWRVVDGLRWAEYKE